jgi:hypothetical protein
MSEQIPTFIELLSCIGRTDEEIALAMNVKKCTARQWRARGSLRPTYWPALIEAVRRKTGREISYDLLGRIAVATAPAPPARSPAENDRIAKARRSLAAYKGWKRRREALVLSEETQERKSTESAEAA